MNRLPFLCDFMRTLDSNECPSSRVGGTIQLLPLTRNLVTFELLISLAASPSLPGLP